MRLRVISCVLGTTSLATLLPHAAVAARQRQSALTVSVRGAVVVDDSSPTPVAGALVTLTADAALPPQSDVTSPAGRFAIDGIAPGRYRLAASKPGLVPSAYGALRPGDGGVSIMVAATGVADILLRMSPGASIAGSARSGYGQPLGGLDVSAVPVSDGRAGGALAHARTDDRGNFRLFGLPPGQYAIVAARSDALPDPVVLSKDEVDAALAALGRGLSAPVRPGGGTPVRAAVYYPDSFDLAGAAILDISRGQTVNGIDFLMRPLLTSRVEGRLSGVDPALTIRGVALAASRGDGSVGARAFATVVEPDGSFSFPRVPAGSYSLLARMRAPELDRPGLWGRTTTTIDEGVDERTIVVVMQPDIVIHGRVTFFGGGRPPADAHLSIAFTEEQDAPLVDAAMRGAVPSTLLAPASVVRPDGQFVAVGLTGGPHHFDVTGLPQDWSIAAAQFAGSDAVDAALDIGLDPDQSLTVIVAPETRISGVVSTNGVGDPSEYSVIAFPVDPAFWPGAVRRLQASAVDGNGSFAVRGLPTGDYFLRAVPSEDADTLLSSRAFEVLSRGAVRVHLEAGERKIQNVTAGTVGS